jgi:hypothetical protein
MIKSHLGQFLLLLLATVEMLQDVFVIIISINNITLLIVLYFWEELVTYTQILFKINLSNVTSNFLHCHCIYKCWA